MLDTDRRWLLHGNQLAVIRSFFGRVLDAAPVVPDANRLFFEFLPRIGFTYCQMGGQWASAVEAGQLEWLTQATSIPIAFQPAPENCLDGRTAIEVLPTRDEAWVAVSCFLTGNALRSVRSEIGERRLGENSVAFHAAYAEFLPLASVTYLHLGGSYWWNAFETQQIGFLKDAAVSFIGMEANNFANQICESDLR